MATDLFEVLEENTQLKLVLLTLMRDTEGWVISEELAEELKATTKRVHSLINELLQDIIDFKCSTIELYVTKGRGIKLEIRNQIDYERFRQFVVENTTIFNIVYHVTMTKNMTLGKLAAVSFISESAVRTKIKKVNQQIEPLGLKVISRKGVYHMAGTETQIRHLLKTVYWRLYRGREWPFPNVDEKKVVQFLRKLAKGLSTEMKEITVYQFAFTFAINYSRSSQGNTIKLKKKWAEYLRICRQIDYQLKISDFMKQQYGLSKAETLFFILECAAKSKIYKNSEQNQFLRMSSLCNTRAWKASTYMINKYEAILGLFSAEEKEKFMEYTFPVHLYADLFDNILYNDSSYYLYDDYFYHFPQLTNRLADVVDEAYRETSFDIFLNKVFLIEEYILIFSTFRQPSYYEREVIIYVETDLSEILEQSLVQQIEQNFGMLFNVKVFTEYKKMSKKYTAFDILISTSVTPTFSELWENVQTFLVHPILTDGEIQRITAYLYQLLHGKVTIE